MEVRECEVAIDPNRTAVTREGACVPTGENFFVLTWNKQGGKAPAERGGAIL